MGKIMDKPRTDDKAPHMSNSNVMSDQTSGQNAFEQKTVAIVSAATTAFLTQGYEATSMDSIALAANVSKRTVYSRFQSKDELFGAAIESSCRKLIPVNPCDVGTDLNAEEFIHALSLHFVKGILRPEALALRRLATFESGRNKTIGRTYLEHGPQWIVENFAPLLGRFAQSSELKIDDPEQALWRLGALISEPLHNRMLMGEEFANLEKEILDQVEYGVATFFKIYNATA